MEALPISMPACNSNPQSNSIILHKNRDLKAISETISLQSGSGMNYKIKSLNDQAIAYAKAEQFSKALVALEKAEKILQYAASYGKQISTSLITVTLKNQAVLHQRLWEVQKCRNYMEGVLVNLEYCFQQNVQYTESENSSSVQNSNNLSFSRKRTNRLNAGIYCLQYSALCSQLLMHSKAKSSVIESLFHFQTLIKDLIKYELQKKGKNSDFLKKLKQFTHLKSVSKQINNSHILLKQTITNLNNIQNNRYFFSFDQNLIKKFGVSQIMHMQFQSVDEYTIQMEKSMEYYISHEGLTHLALYVSCCYFVMATQMRLFNSTVTTEQTQKSTEQYKNSQKYHLFSVYVCSTLVLCDSNFLQHITKSLHNNYSVDLCQLMKEQDPLKFYRQWQISDVSSIDIDSLNTFVSVQSLLNEVHLKICRTESSKQKDSGCTKMSTVEVQSEKKLKKQQRNGQVKLSPIQNKRKPKRYIKQFKLKQSFKQIVMLKKSTRVKTEYSQEGFKNVSKRQKNLRTSISKKCANLKIKSQKQGQHKSIQKSKRNQIHNQYGCKNQLKSTSKHQYNLKIKSQTPNKKHKKCIKISKEKSSSKQLKLKEKLNEYYS